MSNSDNTGTAGETSQNITSASGTDTSDAETLVVVSKIKRLIKTQAGLNTGQCAIEALTKKVVAELNRGIENARKAGRKTVMGRDILA